MMSNEFNITTAILMANGYDAEQIISQGQFSQTAQGKAINDLAVAAIVAGYALLPPIWTPQPSADAATTTTLPACTYANGASGVGATLTGNSNGALSAQDGVTLVVNQRLLVKDQASGLQNGLYVLTQVGTGGTPFILTREVAMDTTGEFVNSVVYVSSGSTNGGGLFKCTNASSPTVGTTAITFARGTAGTVIPYGSISTPGYAFLKNLDTTNYLHYGTSVAGCLQPLGKLKAGEADKIRIGPNVVLRALADTAALKMLCAVFED